jgi:hypothetical protein
MLGNDRDLAMIDAIKRGQVRGDGFEGVDEAMIFKPAQY